jgi:GNAT superfamily N-acetyltransferase
MAQFLESQRDGLTLSTDPGRLDFDAITGMLSGAYWAKGRTRAVIERAFAHSLVFGVYDGERQVALARVVTDYATFAWVCDVFVQAAYRGRGVGKWMMESMLGHPDVQGLRRWLLATRDAHGLYRQYGFGELQAPERWMEIFNQPA